MQVWDSQCVNCSTVDCTIDSVDEYEVGLSPLFITFWNVCSNVKDEMHLVVFVCNRVPDKGTSTSILLPIRPLLQRQEQSCATQSRPVFSLIKTTRQTLTVVHEVLKANEAYASTFQKGDLPMPPARKVAVLTCMDARIHPARALGLEEGDAHVIRNAGGRAADALRSLIISEQLLGTTHIVVVHHTDCGMLTFSNEQLRSKLRQDLNADAGNIDFLPFSDLEQSVRDDVNLLRNSSFIPKSIDISGFIYDVKSGKLLPVT